MTYSEWRNDPTLAGELKQILAMPALQKAIEVIEGMSSAKTLGNTNALVQLADKAAILFGYDAGRYSFITDLENLATVPEPVKIPEPTYRGEF